MEPTNRRRILRALEVTLGAGRPFSSFGPGLGVYPPTPFAQVGVRVPRDILDRRIGERYRRQMESGFLDEVAALGKRSEPLSSTAAQALGYRQFLAYLRGDCDLEEAVDAAVAATRIAAGFPGLPTANCVNNSFHTFSASSRRPAIS